MHSCHFFPAPLWSISLHGCLAAFMALDRKPFCVCWCLCLCGVCVCVCAFVYIWSSDVVCTHSSSVPFEQIFITRCSRCTRPELRCCWEDVWRPPLTPTSTTVKHFSLAAHLASSAGLNTKQLLDNTRNRGVLVRVRARPRLLNGLSKSPWAYLPKPDPAIYKEM